MYYVYMFVCALVNGNLNPLVFMSCLKVQVTVFSIKKIAISMYTPVKNMYTLSYHRTISDIVII